MVEESPLKQQNKLNQNFVEPTIHWSTGQWKNVPPPMLKISIFFGVDLQGFPNIFHIDSTNSNDFYVTPLEFFIDILNRVGWGIFLENPIWSTSGQ